MKICVLKRSYTGILILTILFIVSCSIGQNASSVSENQPEDIIKTYIKESRAGNFSNIEDIITTSPQSYWDYKYKKNKTEDSGMIPGGGDVIDSIIFEKISDKFPKTVMDKKLKIDKILGKWVKGDECRIKIKFSYDTQKTFLSPYVTEKDFYLVKKNNHWKIFEILYDDTNESYPL